MNFWLILSVIIVASCIGIFFFYRAREASFAKSLEVRLTAAKSSHDADFCSLSTTLPPPVSRYFRHVLGEDQRLIRPVEILQSGELRAGTEGHVGVRDLVDHLDTLSNIRRLAEQADKAARYLTILSDYLAMDPIPEQDVRSEE